MRTLLFCTAYAEHPSVWECRYRPWLDAVLGGGLGAHQVLLVDDGSATLPGWADTPVVTVDVLGDAFALTAAAPVTLVHFRHRLGRADILNFPGWHRSFCFAALYAQRHQFDRVIHIESDAFVISAAAHDFLLGFADGWATFWSEQYGMPESAVQVAAGEGGRRLAEFARQPYDALIGRTHEHAIPFTHVEKRFRGARFGEFTRAIPHDADYAAQVPSRRERGFLWFLAGRRPASAPTDAVTWDLCQPNAAPGSLRDGWSAPEERHRWTVGTESTVILPSLRGKGDAVLRLRVTPHVLGTKLTRQRLIVEVNGVALREFHVALESLLGCDMPASCLDRPGGDVLRLIHPDAAAPSDLAAGSGDTRRLSVSVERLEFERW